MALTRHTYFYNVLFLVIFTVTLYVVSSQFLYQEARSEGSSTKPLRYTQGDLPVENETKKKEGDEENDLREERRNWIAVLQDTVKRVYDNFSFSANYLPQFRQWAIEQERAALKIETSEFFASGNTTMKDLVMEKGGQPIRNLIFTTWRSGSTFLGEVLESHPGTFYHYEPLLHHGIIQFRYGQPAQNALRHVQDLLNCRFENMTDYIKFGEAHDFTFSHNTRMYQYCTKTHRVCVAEDFLSKMCRLFPFQLLKTVRMRLKLAEPLLEDEKLNVKVVLLVRDPRGTIQSRHHREWCPGNPDCEDPALLCADLQEDYREALRLRKKYPNKFIAIRYEDVSMNPSSGVNKLFPFLRLQRSHIIDEFLRLHTGTDAGGVSSTFRDSKKAPFHWITDFANDFHEVDVIQRKCRVAMKYWGYEPAENLTQLLSSNFSSIRSPPWPEMIIPQDPQ